MLSVFLVYLSKDQSHGNYSDSKQHLSGGLSDLGRLSSMSAMAVRCGVSIIWQTLKEVMRLGSNNITYCSKRNEVNSAFKIQSGRNED